jgi:hypothetical protein
MGQTSRDAAVMDALIKFSKEECALGMGQSTNYATEQDAQIMSSKEEYA